VDAHTHTHTHARARARTHTPLSFSLLISPCACVRVCVCVSQNVALMFAPSVLRRCYAGRSAPADVARSMQDTFICSDSRDDAGPTNNWAEPSEMRDELTGLFEGCMEGRTMYVVPFCMGPLDAPGAKFCVQLTDSAYVVTHLRLTTRMEAKALDRIRGGSDFIQLMHSVGCPLVPGEEKTPEGIVARSEWPCNIPKRKIVHFPESSEVWSFGSGYVTLALASFCFSFFLSALLFFLYFFVEIVTLFLHFVSLLSILLLHVRLNAAR
jgi:GTP-dependent phosphoenolpyruvate carboxykinase